MRSGVRATEMLPQRFQPVACPVSASRRLVEVGAVADEPREVGGGAELAHEPGGVPRGAAGQPALLQEHDVAASRPVRW